MTVQYQTISIPFGAGLDSKSDPKMLAPPKLALLQDAIFTNLKRVTKRNGYINMTNAVVAGGTWSSPTMAKSYKNELMLSATASSSAVFPGQRLFSYSPNVTAWQDKGKYVSVSVSKQIVNSPVSTQYLFQGGAVGLANASVATLGNFALYAVDNQYGYNAFGTSAITVIDLTTGTHLVDLLAVPGSIGWSKAVVLGTSSLAVIYVSDSATFQLSVRIVNINSASGVVIGPKFDIATGRARTSGTYRYCYDTVTTSTGATIAQADVDNNQIVLTNIDTHGVILNQTASPTSGNIQPISINQGSNGNFWLYWVQSGTALKYATFTSGLSSALAPTSIATVANPSQVCAVETSATIQKVYYSQFTYPAAQIGVIYPYILSAVVNSAGTVTLPNTYFLSNVDIYGKPIVYNSVSYLAVYNLSAYSSSGFLVDTSDGLPVAKFLYGQAEGIFQNVGDTTGSIINQTAVIISIRYPGFLAPISIINTSQLILAGSFVVSLSPFTYVTTNNSTVYPEIETVGAILGMASILLDFNHIDAYQGLVQQDTLVLNGGFVSQYDSNQISELGFHVDPDSVTAVVSTTGGLITAGQYLYYVVYSWSDALGNVHLSAPSQPIVVRTTGSTSSVNLTFPSISMTQKSNVTGNIYRTQNNGTIGYLLTGAGISPSTLSYTYSDLAADSSIGTAPTIYTQGGAVVDNVAAPPSMILWTNNNRLWLVDSENPETNIEYSKTASTGSGISFSFGLLELVIDSKYGAITGVSPMDEKTVILKEKGAFYFIGDGANDSGNGATITNPQVVPSDTGCSNSKSVILFPGGVLFRSTNNKGVYLFSRGVQISYFGLDVNSFNSQDIQSALLVPNRNQIRFLTSSGSSLLYDYVMNQWSVFTNHAGLSADSFQGAYVYVRSDGKLYLEDQTGRYLDDTVPIAPLLLLSWIKAGSIQGFQRTRRIGLLGDFLTSNNGHGVQVSVAYDFQPSFSLPVPYIFNAANGPFQYRERLARQKCDAFQLQIQEIVTGATGEYVDFSDLALEIAVKTGINKQPGWQSVG